MDHNAVTLVRLEPAAPRSRVKHYTTEPLRSLYGLEQIEIHFLRGSQQNEFFWGVSEKRMFLGL